jgi:beta-xylosidase
MAAVVFLSIAYGAGDAPRERVLFEDQFNGKLGDGWSWLYEDKENWRVEGGKLQIRATGGASFMKEHTGKNYLLRTPPDAKAAELSVEAYVENKPTAQYEHAGLMWFYDDDNFVVINKECFGGKASIIFFVEKDSKPVPHKKTEIPYEAEGVWMRFLVNGTHIIGEYRALPTDLWREVGHGELPVKGPPTVGFHAGYAPKKESNRWASFSQFKIAELAKE